MQTSSNIIDKNWKALIKPNKFNISSNEDKDYLLKFYLTLKKKVFGQTYWEFLY
jgi:hypothetical protein